MSNIYILESKVWHSKYIYIYENSLIFNEKKLLDNFKKSFHLCACINFFICACQFQLFSLVHDGLFFHTLNIYPNDNKIKINGINI
jgi:hypothetical protein